MHLHSLITPGSKERGIASLNLKQDGILWVALKTISNFPDGNCSLSSLLSLNKWEESVIDLKTQFFEKFCTFYDLLTDLLNEKLALLGQ